MDRGHPLRLSAKRENIPKQFFREVTAGFARGGQDVRDPSIHLTIQNP